VSKTAQRTAEQALHDEQTFADAFGEFTAAARACRRTGKGLDAAGALFERLMAADPMAVERFSLSHERALIEEKWLFIWLNNRLVERHFAERKPRSGLVLLPFCLQQTSCPHRIVWDLSNCKRCGKCAVGPTLELAGRANLPVKVAVRGVFGPEFIREVRPELTIAVACEDELFKGVLRAAGFRCYGVIGRQPEGYCRNTTVAAEELAAALDLFFPPGP
jgi:hypothetical protein